MADVHSPRGHSGSPDKRRGNEDPWVCLQPWGEHSEVPVGAREGRPPSHAAAGPVHSAGTGRGPWRASRISQKGGHDSHLQGLPWKPHVFSTSDGAAGKNAFQICLPSLQALTLLQGSALPIARPAPPPLGSDPSPRSAGRAPRRPRSLGGTEKREPSEDLRYDRDRDESTDGMGVCGRAGASEGTRTVRPGVRGSLVGGRKTERWAHHPPQMGSFRINRVGGLK